MLYNVEYSECTVVSFLSSVKFSSFQGYSKVPTGVPHRPLWALLICVMHIFRSLSLTRGHAGEESQLCCRGHLIPSMLVHGEGLCMWDVISNTPLITAKTTTTSALSSDKLAMTAASECCACAHALRLAISNVGVDAPSAQPCVGTLFQSNNTATRTTRHQQSGLALLLLGVLHVLVLPTVVVVRLGVGVVVVILRLADEPQRRKCVAATPLKAPSVLQHKQ